MFMALLSKRPMMDQLPPLTVTSPNTITEETESKETQGTLVALCYSDFDCDRCWRIIWDEKPQVWHEIPRPWETTDTGEHTHADVQTLAHSYATLRRKHTKLWSLWEGDALLKHSFTNCLPVNYTTAECLLQILEQLSSVSEQKM